MRFIRRASLLLCALSLACSSRASDSDGDDATSGQSSSEAGTETADGGGGDPELEALCLTGCERFLECAPNEYAAAYADDQACFDYCFTTFSATDACREAAGPYATCTAGLECSEWPALLADPATSACAEEWAVAGPACGLI
jgi:hypothetical protein